MTPKHEHDEHEKHKHDSALAHGVNTSENASKAVAFARSALGSLSAGKVWMHRAHRGEFEIKGALKREKDVALVLHFSPENGSILPKGLHGLSEGNPEMLSTVANKLESLPKELTALEGAEFREPESCWAVPISYQGRIVGHIKISSDGSTLVPDRKASEEIMRLQEG
jgi:hypothetical protein